MPKTRIQHPLQDQTQRVLAGLQQPHVFQSHGVLDFNNVSFHSVVGQVVVRGRFERSARRCRNVAKNELPKTLKIGMAVQRTKTYRRATDNQATGEVAVGRYVQVVSNNNISISSCQSCSR